MKNNNEELQLQSLKETEVAFSTEEFLPGNLAITSDGTMYISVNPLLKPDVKIYRVSQNREVAEPYPSIEYSVGSRSVLGGVLGIRADSHDNLWFLDMDEYKMVVWDTKSEKHVRTYNIDETQLRPNSFLQDFVIDEKRGRVIIADMTLSSAEHPDTYPAFVVLDTNSGEVRRMAEKHPFMLADTKGGFDLNPIAIDPECEWLYFGAIHSHNLFRVPCEAFDKESELLSHFERYGTKSYCDGIAVDDNANVYITNVEDYAIGVTTKQEFRNIAKLPEGQRWPDGMYIAKDGYVYCSISQLSESTVMNEGVDKSHKPYMVVRVKLLPL